MIAERILPAALELAWPDPRLLDLLEAAALAALAPAAYLFVRALTASAWTAAAIAAPLPFWPVVSVTALIYYAVSTVLAGASPGTRLTDLLRQRDYDTPAVEGIMYGNWVRFFREAWAGK